MDLSVWILICLMAICTSAEVESKPKSGRGKGSMWWYVDYSYHLTYLCFICHCVGLLKKFIWLKQSNIVRVSIADYNITNNAVLTCHRKRDSILIWTVKCHLFCGFKGTESFLINRFSIEMFQLSGRLLYCNRGVINHS